MALVIGNSAYNAMPNSLQPLPNPAAIQNHKFPMPSKPTKTAYQYHKHKPPHLPPINMKESEQSKLLVQACCIFLQG
jgi:hypothetical protein